MIKVLLFDAANTLIHKPAIWKNWLSVLSDNGANQDLLHLKKIHKLTSETLTFPDRTSKEFYHHFNTKVLYNLGILPNQKLLHQLFDAMTYKPWECFSDVNCLLNYKLSKMVASNFKSDLRELLPTLTNVTFDKYFISEEMGLRKPSTEFYQKIITDLNIAPESIFYFGDSLELDVQPARELGINAYLIDRDNIYSESTFSIKSFSEIENILNITNGKK